MKKGLNMQDVVFFGRIISTSLLFFGYILLGLYLGKELLKRGYPQWTMTASILSGTVIGLIHGAKALKDIVNKAKKK